MAFTVRLFCIVCLIQCATFVSTIDKSSTTIYINSDDRVRLKLSSHPILRGPPGTTLNLKLLLINVGGASNFHIHQESEDGFLGDVMDPDTSFLTTNMRQEISVLRMRVPDTALEGTVIRTTFYAFRDRYERKRSANKEYKEYRPQSGHVNVDKASVSIEYTITSGSSSEYYQPVGSIHYQAQSSDETCQSTVGEEQCQYENWSLTVYMHDENVGIVRPEILATSTNFGGEEDPVHYKMVNYPIGTKERQRVDIRVTCCMKNIGIQIINTAGEITEMKANSNDYGNVDSDSLWSDGLFIAFIVIAILILLLLIGLCAICIHVRRARYRAVSQRAR
ncbi:uncharacterized protein [Lepeophtheirus salmonis]|uniref:uncharacterized protein n=1 Tax=Lepeophtheirus salmonis TaxID=72036 RepID=UPI001AE63208|nr:uncharacterized protein LOC121129415 isoform X1 [Lepeophtheirus salmonis]XP_040581081.1 uncharacterized protein LOC121129415 isoform X1 [Lepeophtheirus salmonis]